MIDKTLESWHQKQCNDLLRKLGIPFIHLEKGASNKARTHRANIPDILFWKMGKAYAFELKAKGKKIKPDQQAYLDILAAEGVVCGWGCEFTSFVDFLVKYGILVEDKK